MDAPKYQPLVRMTFDPEMLKEAVREFLGRRGWKVENVWSDGDGLEVYAEAPTGDDLDLVAGVVR